MCAGNGVACGNQQRIPVLLRQHAVRGRAISCVGGRPKTEVCNGIARLRTDNRHRRRHPPSDSVGHATCLRRRPTAATQPCKAGTKACQGGVVVWRGFGDTCHGATTSCGDDRLATAAHQPTEPADRPLNCGSCGHICSAGAPHLTSGPARRCLHVAGLPAGYWDINNNHADGCEYACNFVSATEPERASTTNATDRSTKA